MNFDTKIAPKEETQNAIYVEAPHIRGFFFSGSFPSDMATFQFKFTMLAFYIHKSQTFLNMRD